jgi:hypothetical protein
MFNTHIRDLPGVALHRSGIQQSFSPCTRAYSSSVALFITFSSVSCALKKILLTCGFTQIYRFSLGGLASLRLPTMRKLGSAWGLAELTCLLLLASLSGRQVEAVNTLLPGEQEIQQLLGTYQVDVSGGPEQMLGCGPCGCNTPCPSGGGTGSGGAQQINMVLSSIECLWKWAQNIWLVTCNL